MMQGGEKPAAPCRGACPAGIDVPRYIRAVREGDFAGALTVIRERIPFPFACGYACVHPCETKCARIQYDEPVAIRMLKKVAAERGDAGDSAVKKLAPTGKRVAVVGAGPCGLSAAHFLNVLGHKVALFEARPLPGGMLRYGIPEYRLPRGIVDKEIGFIRDGGVEMFANRPVASIKSLLEEGFDAVLAACGAWKPVRMGIPGEDNPSVLDGIVFLEGINGGKPFAVGKRVIVVGGGNTAIDAARVSRRLGAEVILLYRRTRAEMPAGSEEIAEAIEEGVCIEYLTAPTTIGKAQSEPHKHEATCIRMKLGETDAAGRPMPVPIPGSEYRLGFDTLIMALGQAAEASAVGLAGRENGTIVTDRQSCATPLPGVFAAGDSVSGPSTIIEAIAAGRAACETIDRYLGGTGVIPEFLPAEEPPHPIEPLPPGERRPVARGIALKKRLNTFAPVEKSYGRDAAIREAGRCFSCDLRNFDVTVDARVCKGCGYCMEACTLGVFSQSDTFNASGYKPFAAVNTELCVGCLRCLYACPDFAIRVDDKET
jgi:NADPH-dependent glutamate synthase beta subunit-like oxidoreductase/NAD-dependent dihydropyrimidine dehydrogenase PreA subunit